MTRTVLDEVGPTMDRFGDETVTALFVMQDRRALMDSYDPRYGATVEHWLKDLQQTNLFMTSGNTDMKGNRAKQPFQQDDPDMYLRVVAERDDGIIVSGAKWETGAAYAHVAFVKPTVGNWIEANRDFRRLLHRPPQRARRAPDLPRPAGTRRRPVRPPAQRPV